jgi:hypothetical protein
VLVQYSLRFWGETPPRLLHVKAEGVFLLIDVYADGLFGVILWKGARRQKPLHKGDSIAWFTGVAPHDPPLPNYFNFLYQQPRNIR